VVYFTPRPLYPRGKTTVPTEVEVGRAPDVTWAFWKREKYLSPIGN